MVICGNCGTKDETWVDGNLIVCSNCGVILEENELESELEYMKQSGSDTYARVGSVVNAENMHLHYRVKSAFGDSRRTLHSYGRETRVNRSQRVLLELMQTKCNELGLGSTYDTEIRQLIKQCIGDKITYKSKTTVWLSSILYIVVRNHELSYSMMDIAAVMGVNLWDLAKYYRKFVSENNYLLPPVNPTILVDRLAHLLMNENELNSPLHVNIVTLSRMLVEIMKKKQLHTGRRPSSLAGAAIKFVSENLGRKFTYEEIQRVLGFGSTSTRKRYKEIKAFMTEHCKTLPLFGTSNITQQDIASKIDVIIQCMYVESGANQGNLKQDQLSSQPDLQSTLADVDEVLDNFELEESFEKSFYEDHSISPRIQVPQNEIWDNRHEVVEILDSESDSEIGSITADKEDSRRELQPKNTQLNTIHPPSFKNKLSEEDIQRRLIEQVKRNISMDHTFDKELQQILGSKKYLECIQKITEKLLVEGESPQQIMKQVTRNHEFSNKEELKSLLFEPMSDQDLEGYNHLIFSDKMAKQKRILAGSILRQVRHPGGKLNKRRRLNESEPIRTPNNAVEFQTLL